MIVEGARGGAAGAVDGGVLDAREADGFGDGAEERRECRVARAGGLEDIEMRAVALVDGVRVVAALALDASDAGEAVERLWVVEAARGVAWPRTRVRSSSMRPNAKRQPSTVEAAPPRRAEPWPSAPVER